jgi:hypothetical protein
MADPNSAVSRLRQLDALSRLLAGKLPRTVDWPSTLELANEALVTPQVYAAAVRSGILSQAPSEVGAYLQEIWARNQERNRRLFIQLRTAIAALNAAGLEPTLLKGAADWVLHGRPSDYPRMLTDLDLLVPPDQAHAAVRALETAGFTVLARHDEPSSHVAAELGRPDDVGVIDLHRRPPGPEDLAQRAMALPGHAIGFTWDGLRAKAPSATLQVFLLVLHDQFHDGGYWRGRFALRHLVDIAALSRHVDWSVIAGLAKTRLVRNAIDVELRAAVALCNARAPITAQRPWVRLQHARRLAQFAWPRFEGLLRQLVA